MSLEKEDNHCERKGSTRSSALILTVSDMDDLCIRKIKQGRLCESSF